MRQSALLVAAAAAFMVAAPTLSSALPAMDHGVVGARAAATPVQKAYYPWAYGYSRPYAYYGYYRPYAYYGYAQPYTYYGYAPYGGYYARQGCYAGACGYYGYSGW